MSQEGEKLLRLVEKAQQGGQEEFIALYQLEWSGERRLNQLASDQDLADDVVQKECIRVAFQALTEEERYIVNSFVYGGYRGDEIAKNLGLIPSTVRSKYRRALRKMRTYLK